MFSSFCNCLSVRSTIGDVHALQEQRQVSKLIDKALKRCAKRAGSVVKLLILGTGESGKSTVLKQIDLIHTSKFTARTRQAHIPIIHSNIIDAIDTIVEHVDAGGAELEEAKSYLQTSLNRESVLEVSAWDAIETVWKSDAVKLWSVEHGQQFNLVDNATYFLDRIGDIRRVDYLPSDQDILRSRCVTTSITETFFVRDGVKFRILDAGGQRGQRRKWIQCFDECTAIIFVSDISR